MDNSRVRKINSIQPRGGDSVVYLMSRDQRINDNFALIEAQNHALAEKSPLIVMFNLFPKTGIRCLQHYDFMVEGLKEVQENLAKLNINFLVTFGDAKENMKIVVERFQPSAIYFDYSPLHAPTETRKKIAAEIDIPCYLVDTHNIIPVWMTSDKEEHAAYTIRPKIQKLLDTYLHEPSKVQKHEFSLKEKIEGPNWESLISKLEVKPLEHYQTEFIPGENAALEVLETFIQKKLENYAEKRNEPTEDAQSNLSIYLHFGQIHALRAALEVNKFFHENKSNTKIAEGRKAFLEEIIVRKELADNFCTYNRNYDNFNGLKDWTKKTLNEHRSDKREQIYTLEQLETAQTYDEAWNAAQIQMLRTGKMHGYMRMYWAKKIGEWTQTPEKAIEYTIYLNDKYSFDGYEPNGYVGILWSIGGLHDRAWQENPVIGKIRPMSFNGLKRKFDVRGYIEAWK